MGEVEAGEDDDGSGRVTLTPFGRWTHDMGSQPTRDIPKGIFLVSLFYSLAYYDSAILFSVQAWRAGKKHFGLVPGRGRTWSENTPSRRTWQLQDR